jgi:hypothetical protein
MDKREEIAWQSLSQSQDLYGRPATRGLSPNNKTKATSTTLVRKGGNDIALAQLYAR